MRLSTRNTPLPGFLAPRALLRGTFFALGLLATGWPLAAQVRIVPMPTAAEQAAVRRKLRRIEARFVPRLRQSHGDPAVGAKLGDALRSVEDERLDHPSAALLAQVQAAREPFALAVAIASEAQHTSMQTTYEIEVLLAALERPLSAAQRATLWAKASVMERRDKALSLAFLARAYESVNEIPAGPGDLGCALDLDRQDRLQGAIETPNACGIAAEQIQEMLDAGLTREAVATFDALPAPLRERVLGHWARPDSGRADLRLSLAAARFLDGDGEGARALLATVQIAPWHPGDPRPERADHAEPAAVWRAVLERLMSAPTAEEGFPLFAEFVDADLFGPGRQVWGVALAAFGRLADRESYPEFSRFAWRNAAGNAFSRKDPVRLPAAVARTVESLRTALATREQQATAAAQAAARASSNTPWPPIRCQVDCDRLDLDPEVKLLALDHSGQKGIAILENDPYFGDLFEIERRDGALLAIRKEIWQS